MKLKKTIIFALLFFSSCSSAPSKLDRPDGIRTANLEDAGWYGWQTTNPRGLDSVAMAPLAYENLALSSAGCADPFYGYHPPRWQERVRACGHFEEVDVIAAFTDDSQIFATQLKHHHPWENQGRGDHVILLFANTVRGIQVQIANLIMSCKIVRRMTVSTHGNLGLANIGTILHPTTAIFAHNITPCAFSYRSRIQFGACAQACRQSAESLRIGIENVFANERFRTASGRPAFEGLQMLFSSDVTNERKSQFWIVESLSTERPQMRSANDISVIYAVEHGRAQTDVSTNELGPCRHNFLAPMSERLRSRLENPFAIENNTQNGALRTTSPPHEPPLGQGAH